MYLPIEKAPSVTASLQPSHHAHLETPYRTFNDSRSQQRLTKSPQIITTVGSSSDYNDISPIIKALANHLASVRQIPKSLIRANNHFTTLQRANTALVSAFALSRQTVRFVESSTVCSSSKTVFISHPPWPSTPQTSHLDTIKT